MDEHEFLVNVGRRIQTIREVRGLTRRDLGLAIGMTEKSANPGVWSIETSARATQIDTLFKVAKVLEVTPGFLLDGGELVVKIEKKTAV